MCKMSHWSRPHAFFVKVHNSEDLLTQACGAKQAQDFLCKCSDLLKAAFIELTVKVHSRQLSTAPLAVTPQLTVLQLQLWEMCGSGLRL